MGKSATVFKDLGKTCSDLLSKDYKVGKTTVEVKSKTPSGVTFTPTATRAGEKVSGDLKAKYAFLPGLETEMVFSTSGSITANVEMADALTSGLMLTVDCARQKAGKAGLLGSANLIAEYKQPAFATKVAFDPYKNDLLASATFAMSDVTLGASADYSTSSASLQKFAAIGQFVQPEFTLMAKLADSKGSKTLGCSYFHKVSGDMQLGVALAKPLSKPDLGIEFGCAYKLDKDTTVKGKVDSEGILCASYKQKMSSLTTMTLAAQIDTINLSDNKHKFGFALNLTP